jgi:hypothetical protein
MMIHGANDIKKASATFWWRFGTIHQGNATRAAAAHGSATTAARSI